MKRKIRVAIVFGGRSAEHEISFQSAESIYSVLDKNKYEAVLIGIDRTGRWLLNNDSHFLLNTNNPEVTLAQGKFQKQLVKIDSGNSETIDVVFPVLHGPYGEDGTIQGFLKLANVPFVGSGVLGSALGMDKDVMKRLLKESKIPTVKLKVFTKSERDNINFNQLTKELGLPLFVKPANLGSSVGVTKAKNQKQFKQAVNKAFEYDNKILIEEFINGREIECSVLGNEDPIASLPGEIILRHEFYSYEAKYLDETGAILKIPAKLPKNIIKKVQDLAVKTFKILCCEGMARVDFFLTKDKIIVNEVNTIPGFTKISMYPKLWEVSGIPYPELVDKLIQLAITRFHRDQKLRTDIPL